MISNTILGIFLLWMFYVLFVWAPFNIYAESACLAKGYPDSQVTVGLEIYCLNINTINLEKL